MSSRIICFSINVSIVNLDAKLGKNIELYAYMTKKICPPNDFGPFYLLQCARVSITLQTIWMNGMNRQQKLYLETFGVVVIVLALVRCAFPSIAGSLNKDTTGADTAIVKAGTGKDTVIQVQSKDTLVKDSTITSWTPVPRNDSHVSFRKGEKHPIVGVLNYSKVFPDSNEVHLVEAGKYGVSVVKDRKEAEQRKSELVYVGASPYFHVDPLKRSIPYLVPRAAVLLNDIGRNFYDSLYVKQIPLHQFIVTSVLRSEEDLANLRKVNHNTSEKSCHLYGTTFDIGYNRYKAVSALDGTPQREVGNDTLKWVLSEVLRDLRQEGRCHVKYEKKQGCFHVTVR